MSKTKLMYIDKLKGTDEHGKYSQMYYVLKKKHTVKTVNTTPYIYMTKLTLLNIVFLEMYERPLVNNLSKN